MRRKKPGADRAPRKGLVCPTIIYLLPVGRMPNTCSPKCRQKAYRIGQRIKKRLRSERLS